MPPGVGVEPLLHRLEQLGLDDRRMHAGVDLAPMDDHAEVGAVAQHVEECAAIERLAAGGLAAAGSALLGADATAASQRSSACTDPSSR